MAEEAGPVVSSDLWNQNEIRTMQEPIRILMLFTIMNRGGAETMVMNYYRNVDRTKVQFDFMVHREERGAYDDEIEALGGRIYRMMPLHPFTFGKYQQQIKDFFDEHPEYKIIHGHCSELGYFVYKEANKRGVPVIIAHAHNPKAFIDSKWIFRFYFKRAMRNYINQYFACGRESALWLFGKKLGEKAIIQYNAINPSIFTYSLDNRKKIREQLNIAENTIVIGHIGRITKQKNHRFLLKIFHQFNKEYSNSILLLIGDGELKEKIKNLVNKYHLDNNIMFLGIRNDIPALMHAMDIFVFPSHYEGLGVVLIEAQAASLPCLVSNNIPQEAFITDLIKARNLKSTIKNWCDDIKAMMQKKKCSSNNEAIEKHHYSIKSQAEWLQNYYLEQWQKH
ncbi:MAG: glycosyltransferase family 1 protein [Bacteroides sp.]|nr:glycosyltransferase family 1 protein [Bacteroides sp.]